MGCFWKIVWGVFYLGRKKKVRQVGAQITGETEPHLPNPLSSPAEKPFYFFEIIHRRIFPSKDDKGKASAWQTDRKGWQKWSIAKTKLVFSAICRPFANRLQSVCYHLAIPFFCYPLFLALNLELSIWFVIDSCNFFVLVLKLSDKLHTSLKGHLCSEDPPPDFSLRFRPQTLPNF